MQISRDNVGLSGTRRPGEEYVGRRSSVFGWGIVDDVGSDAIKMRKEGG